jgi:hypothetical protein
MAKLQAGSTLHKLTGGGKKLGPAIRAPPQGGPGRDRPAYPVPRRNRQPYGARTGRRGDDAELEDGDPAEDDGLREPALGSVGFYAHSDQRAWAAGSNRDLEQDPAESGIADQDGLRRTGPVQDWQHIGMV